MIDGPRRFRRPQKVSITAAMADTSPVLEKEPEVVVDWLPDPARPGAPFITTVRTDHHTGGRSVKFETSRLWAEGYVTREADGIDGRALQQEAEAAVDHLKTVMVTTYGLAGHAAVEAARILTRRTSETSQRMTPAVDAAAKVLGTLPGHVRGMMTDAMWERFAGDLAFSVLRAFMDDVPKEARRGR